MKAALARKIALREAMKPIFAEITEATMEGRFCRLFLDMTIDCQKELTRLGYHVEHGSVGTFVYVMW